MDVGGLSAAIDSALAEACRFNEFADLGGYDAVNAYDSVIEMLERGLSEARALRGHEHKWNSDDQCSVCGADGRA